jgi:hypothetical protein
MQVFLPLRQPHSSVKTPSPVKSAVSSPTAIVSSGCAAGRSCTCWRARPQHSFPEVRLCQRWRGLGRRCLAALLEGGARRRGSSQGSGGCHCASRRPKHSGDGARPSRIAATVAAVALGPRDCSALTRAERLTKGQTTLNAFRPALSPAATSVPALTAGYSQLLRRL